MTVAELLELPAAAAAVRAAARGAAATVADMVAIAQIPAPSHEEAARADWLTRRWREAGFAEPQRDEVGNVILRYGAGGEPLVVAAHLDTVFPRDTPLELRREGARISLPGITDNARGVAVMVAVAESMARAGLRTARPLAFVGSVGEEGAGDLRGVKHLFLGGGALADAHAFVAIDGAGVRRIVHRGVGARRLRVTIHGPGGHSWSDRGAPNALHVAADAIAAIAGITPPADTPAAVTVARAAGGISINAIPAEAWFEVDVRSESAAVLADLDAAVRAATAAALERAGPAVSAGIAIIGDRPAGATAADHPLVGAAIAATEHLGRGYELVASSTDANVPMACGVPAIAIGGGGESGGTHTLGEWYRDEDGSTGVVRALLALLLAAGVA